MIFHFFDGLGVTLDHATDLFALVRVNQEHDFVMTHKCSLRVAACRRTVRQGVNVFLACLVERRTNACPRGKAFAIAETTQPMRTLCTTAATAFPAFPVLPVRVRGEIPKERMFDVMAAINAVVVDFPAARGDVILENVCGLGVDVIATSNLLSEEGERP